MNVRYKILFLVPFVLLTSCGKNREYKNVVKNIKDTDDKKLIVVRDVNDNSERIVILDFYNHIDAARDFKFLAVGDTVNVVIDAMCNEKYYTDGRTLFYPFAGVSVNRDSINARKQRAELEKQKQNMMGDTCR
jgi:hypothetical protein